MTIVSTRTLTSNDTDRKGAADFPSQPGLSPVLSLGPPASDTSNLLHSPHLAPVDFPARSNSGPPTPIEEIADEAALHDIAQGRTHRHRSSILPGGRVRQPSVSIARAVPPASTSSGAVSLAPPTSPLLNPSRQRRTVAAVSPTHGHHSIRPSLLGAIEFRDVVNSLANQAAAQGTRPTSMLFGSSTSSLARPKHARASSFSHSGRASSSGFDADSRADDDLPSSRRARLTPGDATKRAVSSEAGAWGRSRGHRPAQSAVVQSSRPPWDWEQDESPVEEREEAEWPVVERRRRSEGDPGAPGPMVWDPPLEQDEEEDGERVDPWRDATPTRANLKLQIPLSRSRSRPPSAGAAAGAVPAIVLTGAAGDLSPIPPSPGRVDSGVNPLFAPSKARKGWIYFKTALSVLFPSLQGWSVKSWLGRFVALISAPAILLLNLTLPVVDADDCESESDGEEKDDGAHENDDDGEGGSGRRPEEDDADLSPESLKLRHERRDHHIAHALHSPAEFPHHDRRSVHSRTPPFASSPIDDADAAVPPLALPASHLESVWEGPSDGQITRALASVQCLLAPLFCLLALFGDDLRWWHFPIVLSLGLVLGAATYLFLADPRHPGRLGLCFVGFFVAMVWILTIVNEVVGVLQCIGHVCGLSDAILGLTIFAMGNSLGDLVANVTVARMGFPVMAMSACFGGWVPPLPLPSTRSADGGVMQADVERAAGHRPVELVHDRQVGQALPAGLFAHAARLGPGPARRPGRHARHRPAQRIPHEQEARRVPHPRLLLRPRRQRRRRGQDDQPTPFRPLVASLSEMMQVLRCMDTRSRLVREQLARKVVELDDPEPARPFLGGGPALFVKVPARDGARPAVDLDIPAVPEAL